MSLRPLRGSTLTQRETDVLKLIAAGLSTLQVATKLGISFKTVASHRAHIMDKLDIHNRASLVRYAIDNKLVERG